VKSQSKFDNGNNENGGLASAWMDTGYLLKDGTLFCFMEVTILKSAQAKITSIHKRLLTFAPDIDKS
jgi:hypothetical protein